MYTYNQKQTYTAMVHTSPKVPVVGEVQRSVAWLHYKKYSFEKNKFTIKSESKVVVYKQNKFH